MKPIKNIKIATTNCGLKYKNRDDLLLISFPQGTTIAGVFTKSTMAAAPVQIARQNLQNKRAKALIVNAGNANAFTGKNGLEAVNQVSNVIAHNLNCESSEIFMSSTGVIGEPLKYELINAAIPYLVKNLSENEDSWQKAAKAIITTDTTIKISSKIVKIDGEEIIINGFTKGSGMIAPNMATMLGYIFTNANICSKLLQKLLSEFCEETFNAITVDYDTSTNDTVLLFSTREAKHEKIRDIDSPKLADFKKALYEIMLDLAKQIVIDGEGATKLIEIKVQNATSKKAAKNIGLAIANSPLVKTALAGSDPNWGRIVMAIGKSFEEVKQEKLGIKIGNFKIVENGELIDNYDEKPVHEYLKSHQVKIIVDINLGDIQNHATIWTCDFTEEYIKINRDYRS